MAAYRQVYGFGHLQADCRGPGSAQKPYVCFEYGTTSLLLLPLSSKGELLGTAEAGILQAGFLSCHLTISVTEGKFWWKNKALFLCYFLTYWSGLTTGPVKGAGTKAGTSAPQVPPSLQLAAPRGQETKLPE